MGGYMPKKKDVQCERDMSLDFINEMKEIPGGEQIVKCIQCGTCSASCPTAFLMKHSPRKLIAMTRAGMRKEVLSSPDIWLCTSCYSCYVRCPRNIKVTDLMYAYKRLSARDSTPIQRRGYWLGRMFMNVVNKYGRNNETELLIKYFAVADWVNAVKNIPVGIKLFNKKRLPLKKHKINGLKEFRAIVKKAQSLQKTP